jgi:hypothetical protein
MLVNMLCAEDSLVGMEFQKIAISHVAIETRPSSSRANMEKPSTATKKVPPVSPASEAKSRSTRKQLQAIASRWSSFSSKGKPDDSTRRATVPLTGPTSAPTPMPRSASNSSLSSTQSAPVLMALSTPSPSQHHAPNLGGSSVNLDYFPISAELGDLTRTSSSTMLAPRKIAAATSSMSHSTGWDQLLDDYESTTSSAYQDLTVNGASSLYQVPSNEWAPGTWQLPGIDPPEKAPVPQSLLSFSEESLTSNDDLLFSTVGSNSDSSRAGDSLDLPKDAYRGITIPVDDDFEFHEA